MLYPASVPRPLFPAAAPDRAAPSPLSLRPARALLHPLWLASLVVLGVNDHLLKGSGLLPGWLTGKLSDIAGLLVAPALFACLVRVRSARGLAAGHALVGAVFAAIKLSPAALAAWSWAFDRLGVGWQGVCDPTDLVALAVLPLGFRAFLPAMAREASAPARVAERALVLAAVPICAATSEPYDPECDEGETYFPTWDYNSGECHRTFETGLYLYNHTDRPLAVTVRAPRQTPPAACGEVSPRVLNCLLPLESFGEPRTLSLEPQGRLTLDEIEPAGAACQVLLLQLDPSAPAAIVTYQPGVAPPSQVPEGTTDLTQLQGVGSGVALDPAPADGVFYRQLDLSPFSTDGNIYRPAGQAFAVVPQGPCELAD
jgi:hypothetical protein